ncbi:MAG: site-specific integrase [Gammaproteobacteria bacterium]|nr:site-specific integrase [Gammaproteobacteria bacterium]MCF6261393.1 site-specific integrase [Gammaproteobacteria bacterium]
MNEITPENRDGQALRNVETAPLPATDQHRYIQAATSDNTRRTYQSAIRHFESWGGLLPATESMVIRYLLDHADRLNPRTLSLRLTALRQWHRLQKFPDPTDGAEVRKTLKGIERLHGQPKRKAKTFRLEHLEAMIASLGGSEGLKAARDRALLLVGFFGAFRRSELATLEVEHLGWEPEGLIITLPRSKTDQTGEGKVKALPAGEGLLCPVTALRQWLSISDIEQGSVFRGITRWGVLKSKALSPASVNLILKTVAKNAGLDFAPELSGHSLRRSLATNAHRFGATFESIKRQGGWVHEGTVWGYIEEAQLFEDNAVAVLLAKVT